jgi:hypothetical protein
MAGCDILHKLRWQLLICVWIPAVRKRTEFEEKNVTLSYTIYKFQGPETGPDAGVAPRVRVRNY